MSKTRMNMNKDSENTDCFDKKKRSLNNLKMFVKRSCKPELITNLNDIDIEDEIKFPPQENKAWGSSTVCLIFDIFNFSNITESL